MAMVLNQDIDTVIEAFGHTDDHAYLSSEVPLAAYKLGYYAVPLFLYYTNYNGEEFPYQPDREDIHNTAIAHKRVIGLFRPNINRNRLHALAFDYETDRFIDPYTTASVEIRDWNLYQLILFVERGNDVHLQDLDYEICEVE